MLQEGNMMKRFIAFFLITTIAAAYSDAAETIHKSDFRRFEKIRLAVFKDLHPFCFQDEHGENKGVMIDIWKLWSKKTGISVEFLPGNSKELTEMVLNGQADAHVGMIPSAERDAVFDFVSSPVSRQSSSFFYHKSIFGIKTLQDLVGFKIGIVKGRYSEEFVRKNLPEATLSLYPTMSELADAAEKGEIRIVIGLIENIRWMFRNRGILSEFHVNQVTPLFTDNLCSAVKKGNCDLADIIEQGMAMISSEERAVIDRKWLGGSEARTKDTLIIAMGNDYPPLFFVNEHGESAGMLADIWRLWSQKTGQKIEFHPDIFHNAIELIRTGKADIHIGLPRSAKRQEWMDFFEPMYESHVNAFYHVRYGKFSNISEFSEHPVGVVRESAAEQFLKEKYPNLTINYFESLEKLVDAVRGGKIHSFLADYVLSTEIISRRGLSGEFESTGEPLFPTIFCAGIRKGNPELYSLIQKGFDRISNQEMAEIESRWIQNPAKRYFPSKIRQIKLTAAEKSWIQQHPTVSFIASVGSAPFAFMGKSGKPEGIVMDYIDILRKNTGINFKIELPKQWTELTPMIREKAIDGIACILKTEEREKYLTFTDNYLQIPWVIITRKDFEGIALKLTDFEGKKVAVIQASPAEEILKNYPKIIVVPVPTPDRTWEAISSGEADAAFNTLLSATHYIRGKGAMYFKIAGAIEGRLRLGMGVRKDLPELLSVLNKAIAIIPLEEHEAIEKKWLSVQYEKGVDWHIVYRWIFLIISISGGIVIITLASNRRLAKEIRIRRQAEDELRRSESFSRSLLEHLPQRIFVKDINSVYLSCNGNFALDVGHDAEQVVGKDDFAFFSQEMAESYRSDDREVISGRIPKDIEEKYTLAGEERWAHTIKVPYYNGQDNLIGLIGIYEDITERRQAEEERRKLESQLRQAQKMEAVGQLAGGVAHDFNNLLQVIIGYGDMMLDQLPPGELLHNNLNEMMKSAHRAASLVRQLLLFSRHDTMRAKSIDLTGLISNLMNMIRRVIGEHISLEIRPGFAVRPVSADPGQIEQVLMNLCVNARDAMPDGGRIIIGTENVLIDDDYHRQHQWAKKGQYVLITVSDTGCGIPHEIQERIFEPFFTTKEVGKGTGLGLATVYGIVRSHQGMVHLYSEPGHGAAFKIYLPAIGETPSGADNGKESIKPPALGKETIMIAEDEEVVRNMIVQVLENSGYRVLSACDGEEAVSLFEKHFSETDLVILDVIMPKESGQKVYEHIRAIRPDIAVMFMSGYTRDILKPEILTENGCQMIQKPCTPSVLLQKIREVLDARKLQSCQS